MDRCFWFCFCFVFSLLSVAKQVGGKKGFVWLRGYNPSLEEVKTETEGKNLEAGNDAEVMEVLCLLVASKLLSSTAQAHLLR